MFKKLIVRCSTMATVDLIKIPLAIGFLFSVASMALFSSTSHLGKLTGGILLSVAFFVWGLMGLPMIIRKEMPWLIMVRGWFAVLEGVVLLLGCWATAIIFAVVVFSAK